MGCSNSQDTANEHIEEDFFTGPIEESIKARQALKKAKIKQEEERIQKEKEDEERRLQEEELERIKKEKERNMKIQEESKQYNLFIQHI